MSNQQWVEKYRPQDFNAVVGFPLHVKKIQTQLAKPGSEFPHMLFSGPAGTGKTSIGKLIAKSLLNGVMVDYKELNASDERGIETVRKEIGDYAEFQPLVGGLKVILLDEADEMTKPAQQAMRGMMEKFKHVKFILTCNDSKKISKPIQSRCVHLKFDKPDRAAILTRLEQIVGMENLVLQSPKETLQALISECYPDIRMMIQTLQILSNEQPITKESVKSLKLKLLESTISKCFDAVMELNPERALTHLKALLNEPAFNYKGFIRYFMFVFMRLKRLYPIPILAYYDRSIILGADMELQMFAMILELIEKRQKMKGVGSETNFDDWRELKIADANTISEEWLS